MSIPRNFTYSKNHPNDLLRDTTIIYLSVRNRPLRKNRNTLCLFPQILHNHCFQFLLGLNNGPKRKQQQCLCKIWGTNKKYYRIFRNGLLWPASSCVMIALLPKQCCGQSRLSSDLNLMFFCLKPANIWHQKHITLKRVLNSQIFSLEQSMWILGHHFFPKHGQK